jgi:hypothetical protein
LNRNEISIKQEPRKCLLINECCTRNILLLYCKRGRKLIFTIKCALYRFNATFFILFASLPGLANKILEISPKKKKWNQVESQQSTKNFYYCCCCCCSRTEENHLTLFVSISLARSWQIKNLLFLFRSVDWINFFQLLFCFSFGFSPSSSASS